MFSVRYRVVSCFSVLMGFIAFLFGKRDDFIDLTFSLLNAFNVSFFLFIYMFVFSLVVVMLIENLKLAFFVRYFCI